MDDLSSKQPAICFACGRASAGSRTCELCSPSTKLRGVSVGVHYGGAVKELILQLKFHRLRAATEAAADLLMRSTGSWPPIDVITSVPVAAARYRERGYNQSELIARLVARRLGLPYSSLLMRATSTHQIGLDRRSRLEQVAGAFFATKRLSGQYVLVVDDVVTTGATLSECAAVLQASGASGVWGAAVARH
jgi:competence protein ComFC